MMTHQSRQILEEAMQLPPQERQELADALLRSLESALEASWAEEVRRRIGSVDSGRTELIPWEQVRDELYEQLHEPKN